MNNLSEMLSDIVGFEVEVEFIEDDETNEVN